MSKNDHQIVQLKVEVYKKGCIFRVDKQCSFIDEFDSIFSMSKSGKDVDECCEEISEDEVYKDRKDGDLQYNRMLIDHWYIDKSKRNDYLVLTDDIYIFEMVGMIGEGCDMYSGPVEFEIRENGSDSVVEDKDQIIKEIMPFVEKKEQALIAARNPVQRHDVHFTVWVPTVWYFNFSSFYDDYSGGYESDCWIEYCGVYDCSKIEKSVLKVENDANTDGENKNEDSN